MELPNSSHFIYIPVLLILGIVLGFVWGAKATREAAILEARAADERAQRKAARAARHAAEGTAPAPQDPAGPKA
jgi:hypothetical protein